MLVYVNGVPKKTNFHLSLWCEFCDVQKIGLHGTIAAFKKTRFQKSNDQVEIHSAWIKRLPWLKKRVESPFEMSWMTRDCKCLLTFQVYQC